MMRFSTLLIVLFLSGCATVNTWNEMGRSRIQIVDMNVVPASQGQDGLIKIVGEKTIPVIPFLVETKLKGEVDAISIIVAEGELRTCSLDLDESYTTNHVCRTRSLSSESLVASNGLNEEGAFKISDNSIPFLVDDLHRYRSFLAVQLTEKCLQDGGREKVILVLRQPYIDYKNYCYVRHEDGARVVVGRILFTPFAFVADVVFFPVGLLFAPFVHM